MNIILNMYKLKDNGDGTVTDPNTILMWTQKPSNEMTWSATFNYCANLNVGGHDDWRVPSLKELLTLVSYDRQPALDEIFSQTNPLCGYLWSKSQSFGASRTAWALNDFRGQTLERSMSEKCQVLAVRTLRGF